MTASSAGDPRPRVYRTRTGIAFVVVSAAVAVFLLADAAVRAGFVQMLLLAPWVLIAVWLVYVLSAASHLRTTAEGVVVQNLIRRTSFGWSRVRDVDFRWQLEFALDDGTTVTAMGAPARSGGLRRRGSGFGADGATPGAGARALADVRGLWLASRGADAPIQRSWDRPALIALAALVVWAAAAVLATR